MPAAKELRKLLGRRQVILREVADDIFRYVRSGDPVVSEAGLFAKRFRALGCGLFDDWTRDDWSNVLVAGGAVLLCALPLPPNYSTLRARATKGPRGAGPGSRNKSYPWPAPFPGAGDPASTLTLLLALTLPESRGPSPSPFVFLYVFQAYP